ncbi:hypothetical protein C5167_037060 [Papaver somniferum]|uniref:Uncharacterized protein n=1 Tax=Papaver somniferum TaxID=3469 RepID=A0A4Y7I597_PAPSO|nr:hypothetical protein C5167_037060 [Papaver somniferum]
MDLGAFLDEDYDSDDYDHSINYGDGYDDYEGVDFSEYIDAEEGEGSEMSPVGTVLKDGTCDEKNKSDRSETRRDSQIILHRHSGDEEKTNMDIENGASEENMATERKKKEKRKSQEDGVESEQNDGIEIAIEVKKKKDSIIESNMKRKLAWISRMGDLEEKKENRQRSMGSNQSRTTVIHEDKAIKERSPSILSTRCAKAAYYSSAISFISDLGTAERQDISLLYMARGTGWLLGMLPGPSRAVNCAGWKPWNLHMLVLFASEGRTVPVRGSICVSLKQKETHDNRVVCHSNGWSSSVSKDDMPIILVRFIGYPISELLNCLWKCLRDEVKANMEKRKLLEDWIRGEGRY